MKTYAVWNIGGEKFDPIHFKAKELAFVHGCALGLSEDDEILWVVREFSYIELVSNGHEASH